MSLYALGVDFGTPVRPDGAGGSGHGEERSSAVYEYPHGVMDTALPDGTLSGRLGARSIRAIGLVCCR